MVYLPPCSPDRNPIETIATKLKKIIRGLRPIHGREIIKAARHALQAMTIDDPVNAFAHRGNGKE